MTVTQMMVLMTVCIVNATVTAVAAYRLDASLGMVALTMVFCTCAICVMLGGVVYAIRTLRIEWSQTVTVKGVGSDGK